MEQGYSEEKLAVPGGGPAGTEGGLIQKAPSLLLRSRKVPGAEVCAEVQVGAGREFSPSL